MKKTAIPSISSMPIARAIPRRSLQWFSLLSLAVIIAAVRVPLLGHILLWDEAWNLCALKSLANGGRIFTFQFWRHPPLYMLAGGLLAPLKAGFDIRMEVMSLTLNITAAIAFIALVAKIYGRNIATYTGVALALMPASIYYDTWVKRDPAALLLSMIFLWLGYRRRYRLAGLFLGLALLAKETAVFYAPALLLFIIADNRPRKTTLLLSSYAIAGLTSGWWYLLFSRSGRSFTDFFIGRGVEAEVFSEPWWYYFADLHTSMGWVAFLLALTGAAILAFPGNRSLKKTLTAPRMLPLYILLPAYTVISISYGKPPWITMGLYPLLALLTATGWALVSRAFPGRAVSGWRGNARLLLHAGTLAGLMAVSFPAGLSYISMFKKFIPGQVGMTTTAYVIADALNHSLKKDETLMILPMDYRNARQKPNPIIYWNLTVPIKIVHYLDREDSMQYTRIKQFIHGNRVNWVLMSPVDGNNQVNIFNKLVIDAHSKIYTLAEHAILLKVDRIWRQEENHAVPAPSTIKLNP